MQVSNFYSYSFYQILIHFSSIEMKTGAGGLESADVWGDIADVSI